MEKYHILARIMHWIMAVIVITILTIGFYMTSLNSSVEIKYNLLYPLHKSLGVLILILVMLRFGIRLCYKPPVLPKEIKAPYIIISRLTILLLYICMFVGPLSGYIMSVSGGHQVMVFGHSLPNLLSENSSISHFAAKIHEIIAYILIAGIVLHILGTAKHLIVDRINLLSRIY